MKSLSNTVTQPRPNDAPRQNPPHRTNRATKDQTSSSSSPSLQLPRLYDTSKLQRFVPPQPPPPPPPPPAPQTIPPPPPNLALPYLPQTSRRIETGSPIDTGSPAYNYDYNPYNPYTPYSQSLYYQFNTPDYNKDCRLCGGGECRLSYLYNKYITDSIYNRYEPEPFGRGIDQEDDFVVVEPYPSFFRSSPLTSKFSRMFVTRKLPPSLCRYASTQEEQHPQDEMQWNFAGHSWRRGRLLWESERKPKSIARLVGFEGSTYLKSAESETEAPMLVDCSDVMESLASPVGQRSLSVWKEGAGRGKSWKSCPKVKVILDRKRGQASARWKSNGRKSSNAALKTPCTYIRSQHSAEMRSIKRLVVRTKISQEDRHWLHETDFDTDTEDRRIMPNFENGMGFDFPAENLFAECLLDMFLYGLFITPGGWQIDQFLYQDTWADVYTLRNTRSREARFEAHVFIDPDDQKGAKYKERKLERTRRNRNYRGFLVINNQQIYLLEAEQSVINFRLHNNAEHFPDLVGKYVCSKKEKLRQQQLRQRPTYAAVLKSALAEDAALEYELAQIELKRNQKRERQQRRRRLERESRRLRLMDE